MRFSIRAVVLLLTSAAPTLAAHESPRAFDFQPWQHLAVQDGGRQKPLDTLAWETLRSLSNRAALADPVTGEKLRPTAFYLALIFDRQPGDKPAGSHAMAGAGPHSGHFATHAPDKWDRLPLLRVDFLALREVLGLPHDQKHVSPLELSRTLVRDPQTGDELPFPTWAGRIAAREAEGLATLEKKGIELADKLWSYQEHRSGRRLKVLPVPESEDGRWTSIADLVRTEFSDSTDPTGAMRQVKQAFEQAREAYRANDAAAFDRASAGFLAAVRDVGPQLGTYPDRATIDLEVAYNQWVPFRFAWMCTLAACVLLLCSGLRSKWLYRAAVAVFGAGLVAMLAGFGMRTAISGRAPVTNMYESVLYLGLGVAVFGLIFELLSRKRYILLASAAIATVALILADNCPAVLDPSMRPLPPVLRNNFWLTTHVMTITLSYAAFALALGIGNVTLGYYLAGSKNRDAVRSQARFTYRSLQVGVLLLAVGTVLGGVWADYSWGRFWGWDPKEVWALITLLGYVAVLHARYTGWVGSRGLAALSVVCFSLVMMAWYGVNYVLGTGLHSYGFGGGGQLWVVSAMLAQLLFVGLCLAVSRARIGRAETAAEPRLARASHEQPVERMERRAA